MALAWQVRRGALAGLVVLGCGEGYRAGMEVGVECRQVGGAVAGGCGRLEGALVAWGMMTPQHG